MDCVQDGVLLRYPIRECDLHSFLTAPDGILPAMNGAMGHVKLCAGNDRQSSLCAGNDRRNAPSRWFTRLVAFVILSVSGGALAHQWLERNQPVVVAQSCKGNACQTADTALSAILPERRIQIATPTIIGEIPEFTLALPRPVLEFFVPVAILVFVPVVFARTRQPRAPPVTA